MKLAFCTFKFFSYGGLEKDFMEILKLCQQHGHQIDIYTMAADIDFPEGVSVFLIPTIGKTNHRRAKNFSDQLHPILQQKTYDIVFGFQRMPGLDLYYGGDVCYEDSVRHKHGAWYRLTDRYQILSSFEHAIFDPDSTTQVFLLTETQKKQYQHYYQTPSERLHLLLPAISPNYETLNKSDEEREAAKVKLGIKPGKTILLFIGSGYHGKGLDRVLLALSQLPSAMKQNIQLFVIGKALGRGRQTWYEWKTKWLGIQNQVQFLGTRNDVPQWILASDILLHPARNEAAGMVLLEALACGLPVLTTDVCGFAPYIQEANAGVVLPSPFEQRAFNEALQHMIESPDQRKQWKENGLQYGQSHDIYHRAEPIVRFIESMKKKA